MAVHDPTWKLAYHTLAGARVGEIRGAKQRKFEFMLNAPSTIQFKLDIQNRGLQDIFTNGGEGYILAYQDGVLRMTAEIMASEIANAPTPGARAPAIQIVATETMWPILQGRLIGKSREGVSLGVGAPVDRGVGLLDLLAGLNTASDTKINVGTSDVLPTMTGGPWHYKPFLELLQELSATVNGFDFEQAPLDPSIAGKTGTLNLYAVKGSARTTILEFGVGQKNARDYKWAMDRQYLLTRAFAVPSDFPNNATLDVVLAENSPAITARGVREGVIQNDLVDTDLRQQLVDEHINVRKQPMERFHLNPVVGPGAPIAFTDYDLGDTIEGRLIDSNLILLDALVRVYGITVELDEQGMETDTLLLHPES